MKLIFAKNVQILNKKKINFIKNFNEFWMRSSKNTETTTVLNPFPNMSEFKRNKIIVFFSQLIIEGTIMRFQEIGRTKI